MVDFSGHGGSLWPVSSSGIHQNLLARLEISRLFLSILIHGFLVLSGAYDSPSRRTTTARTSPCELMQFSIDFGDNFAVKIRQINCWKSQEPIVKLLICVRFSLFRAAEISFPVEHNESKHELSEPIKIDSYQ